ncbi:hypothetical protein [Flavobacterium pectinovorum]|uniref:Uncharacterized protein n=1 Tax=Flavobacterium pectinovorum TaxID=29533 RepID=A0AB36NX38_9FLAO|nr:hypothetical protein [Flavobacterium pectinovorum]OXB01918.1 hypothetical protein B0A72_17915 [Flavobacterium pectinovorum]SHN15696.1 hypothetical protein SAMN05444387_4416 [Flavobacterium pectinovorum]
MTFESLINNLKHFVFIAVPLSLAMTYTGVFFFYINFNVDISTYLGFEDLTIIYSKYTIISLLYLFFIFIVLRKLFEEKEQEGFWDKTIMSTTFKRKIIPTIIIILFIIFIMVFNETLRILFSIVLISILLVSVIGFSANNLFNPNDYPLEKHKREEDLLGFISALLFFILIIPVAVGFNCKNFITRESVIVHLENDKIIDAQEDSNLQFIGKTSSFVFILDSINKKTMVFPIDKIIEIEYCNTK